MDLQISSHAVVDYWITPNCHAVQCIIQHVDTGLPLLSDMQTVYDLLMAGF